jgi:3-oxoacyl-[acyl-carrier protein] reductase
MIKNIVITGTSKGLGNSLAKYLLNKGHKIFGISKTLCPIEHENYRHIQLDISSPEVDIFKNFSKDFKIDILINNAAIFLMKKFEETSFSEINNIIGTNLLGSIYITKSCIPHMNNGAKIIFVNSVAGLQELENQSIYCASKAGLTSFAGVLGLELRSKNISVTSIHPGGINTTLWSDKNPYPCGDVSEALSTDDICNLVDLILYSKAVYKNIKLFPSIEWH